MGQVLYRKYRPKSLSDVIGQDHVTQTLISALKKGLVSHAYLLTGPRGVGKTSIARILAYELNQVEYDEDKNYVDIIEIDAASNRRIDEVRELRDKINIVPTTLKYKVYIIDEVHMLTREAFNALLKTLEEPPEHAIFILATTELHKVPETIVSRCQRYVVKQIPEVTAIQRLKFIAKEEDITIDDDSLSLIVAHSRGSFRDALSLLDQLGGLTDKVTADETRNVLGVAKETTVQELVESMKSGELVTILAHFRQAMRAGNDPVVLADQIAENIRAGLNKSISPKADVETLKALLGVATSRYPETELEIVLLSRVSGQNPTEPQQPKEPHITTPAKKVKKQAENKQKKTLEPKQKTVEPAGQARVMQESDWTTVLNEIKQARSTLYSILRMAQPKVDAGELKLHFTFPFHVKRASDSANKSLLEHTISKLGLSVSAIEMLHSKEDSKKEANEETQSPEPVNEESIPKGVLDVFNGAEVLES